MTRPPFRPRAPSTATSAARSPSRASSFRWRPKWRRVLNRHARQIQQVTESGRQALVKLQRGVTPRRSARISSGASHRRLRGARSGRGIRQDAAAIPHHQGPAQGPARRTRVHLEGPDRGGVHAGAGRARRGGRLAPRGRIRAGRWSSRLANRSCCTKDSRSSSAPLWIGTTE